MRKRKDSRAAASNIRNARGTRVKDNRVPRNPFVFWPRAGSKRTCAHPGALLIIVIIAIIDNNPAETAGRLSSTVSSRIYPLRSIIGPKIIGVAIWCSRSRRHLRRSLSLCLRPARACLRAGDTIISPGANNWTAVSLSLSSKKDSALWTSLSSAICRLRCPFFP